jgi:hypothetical protein
MEKTIKGKKLQVEELQSLSYASPNMTLIKPRRVRNAYNILAWKSEWKNKLGEPWHR